ncbi:MAG: peptidylprolyl isomerase [Planctomycetes bacterium]|nr:peptidylprolyl isomerase [Planctomycetota bacterium]
MGMRPYRQIVLVLATAATLSLFVSLCQAEEPVADTPAVTVGNKSIMNSEVQDTMDRANVPAFRRSEAESQILQILTKRLLLEQYMEGHKLPIDEKKFERGVADLRIQLAIGKVVQDAATEEKIKAYIAEHPQFFDGTQVKVRHILILSPVSDSNADQLAAYNKLSDIAKKISDGELAFADAVKAYSDDPGSKERGGEYPAFGFLGQMDTVFTIASFTTPKGKVSPIIRTGYGWHIIEVLDITPGDGKPKSFTNSQTKKTVSPEQAASYAIRAQVENQILQDAIREYQVVNHLKGK